MPAAYERSDGWCPCDRSRWAATFIARTYCSASSTAAAHRVHAVMCSAYNADSARGKVPIEYASAVSAVSAGQRFGAGATPSYYALPVPVSMGQTSI